MAVNINVAAVIIAILVVLIVIFIYVRYFKLGSLEISEQCTKNRDCANNACGRPTAAAGGYLCCPSGRTSTYWGVDYCADMPDLSACWSHAMCASGNCRDPNFASGRRGVCERKAAPDNFCDDNTDCENGQCGRPEAGTNARKVCCKPGQVAKEYGGYDYCTPMPHGVNCFSDAQCKKGGRCKNAGWGLGICWEPQPVGAFCTMDADCLNKQCGFLDSRPETKWSCCPPGRPQKTLGGADYCTNAPKDTTCRWDGQCASGNCKGNTWGRGMCT